MNDQRRLEIEAVFAELTDLRARVEAIQQEEQEAFDNMPGGCSRPRAARPAKPQPPHSTMP